MNVQVDVRNLDNWIKGLSAISTNNIRTNLIAPVFDRLGILLTTSIADEFRGEPFEYMGLMSQRAPGKYSVITDEDSLEIYEPVYYGRFIREPSGPRGKWLPPVYIWALHKIYKVKDPSTASPEAKAGARRITLYIMNYGAGYSRKSPLVTSYPEGQIGFDYPEYVTWIKNQGKEFYESVELMESELHQLIYRYAKFTT